MRALVGGGSKQILFMRRYKRLKKGDLQYRYFNWFYRSENMVFWGAFVLKTKLKGEENVAHFVARWPTTAQADHVFC